MGKAKLKVLVLGAGFGGLELTSILSERMGEFLDLTLIDQNDSFFFGFSKLDVMFGRKTGEAVKIPYQHLRKPGVQFRKEQILAIDPQTRNVRTSAAKYQADVIVVALGADYDLTATPGLEEGGNEFYSFKGAEKISQILPRFEKGHIIVGVTSAPFKCPPAPSEAAILLDEYLVNRGVRNKCKISLVVPFDLPIPPSYGTSRALMREFDNRGINYVPEIMVYAIEPSRKLAILDDGREMPFDLFLGIPEHTVPPVVKESGLAPGDWIPVDKGQLKTQFPQVYAIGDVTSVGTPKAGIFAEGAAKVVAEVILAEYQDRQFNGGYDGLGSCYIEFGNRKVAKVDVDFLSGPTATGVHHEASRKIAAEKAEYARTRTSRWFAVEFEGLL